MSRTPILWTLALLAAPVLAQETVTYSYNGGFLPIVYDPNNFSVAEIRVPRALQIQNVTVEVEIDYENLSDLNVFLFSPFGTRTRLIERNCATVRNLDTVFSDAAPTMFSSYCPVELGAGPFRGNEPLANSNGETSLGVWRLAVQNNGTPGRRGTLRTFSVTITGTQQSGPIITPDTIVNAASLRGSFIAPGEVIAIYGSGLGPLTPVTAPAGDLPLSLAGTEVIIDGVRARIFYTSRSHVEVQVPFAEIPGTWAYIQAGYNGQGSPVISLPVRSMAPGVYTVSPGSPQARVVNQDGSINSKSSPAPRGSYVSLFASGLGDTNPLISSGAVTPSNPLIYTYYPIAAYVGGVRADVQFSGMAPGFVGLYQVNIRIPDDVGTGTQNVALVGANGATSQENATIEIQ